MAFISSTPTQKNSGKNSFIKDFQDRLNKYSSLGWKNRKGLGKGTVQGQVPAFAINFFSKSNLAILKKYPKLYDPLSRIHLSFQYIKYKPKEAMRLYTQRQLFLAKQNVKRQNTIRKRQGLKPFTLPTSESLGLKEKKEEFKRTYPKILKRKRDGVIDCIKSDWSGYLVSFISGDLKDGQVLGNDFFFKNAAIMTSTTKTDIIEKIEKKTKKILEGIDSGINSFIYGSQSDYHMNERSILTLAQSLTPKGILEKMEEERKKEIEEELNNIKQVGGETKKLDLNWEDFN